MRFPILKFLRATRKEMEAFPIFQHNLDRRMSEEAARAVMFALSHKFERDKWQEQESTPKGGWHEWLETQHRIFSEMEENGFVPPVTPSPGHSSTTSLHPSVITGAHRVKANSGYRETVLKKRIGQGTYGSIFRGQCRDEEVVVKVMLLQADSAEDIKREIKIMRECACESIVAYRDAFIREHQMGSTLWVVMEFCEVGSTLDMMRRRNQALGEPQIAWIMHGVLIGLDYLHTKHNVIHRNIKAANILLTRAGGVKLAKLKLGAKTPLSLTLPKLDTTAKTPHWTAPEALTKLCTGDGKYDVMVDVWGVGITAIELVQMSPPYADVSSVYQVLMRIHNGEPPKPEAHIETTETFKGFLSRALVKDPAKRPSAAELLLEDFIKGAKIDSLRDLIETHLNQGHGREG